MLLNDFLMSLYGFFVLLNNFLMPLHGFPVRLNGFHRRLNNFHERLHDFLTLVQAMHERVDDLIGLLSLFISRLYFSTLFFDFIFRLCIRIQIGECATDASVLVLARKFLDRLYRRPAFAFVRGRRC